MDKLDELIVKIYEIIPAYYDEKEAIEIKKTNFRLYKRRVQ